MLIESDYADYDQDQKAQEAEYSQINDKSALEHLFDQAGPILMWLAGILIFLNIGAQIFIALNNIEG